MLSDVAHKLISPFHGLTDRDFNSDFLVDL